MPPSLVAWDPQRGPNQVSYIMSLAKAPLLASYKLIKLVFYVFASHQTNSNQFKRSPGSPRSPWAPMERRSRSWKPRWSGRRRWSKKRWNASRTTRRLAHLATGRWGGGQGAMLKPWWSHGEAMVKPWWSHGEAMVKPWSCWLSRLRVLLGKCLFIGHV